MDRDCGISCVLDPAEFVVVSSEPLDYESVSFFSLNFHCFCWLVACLLCRAAPLNITTPSSLQQAQRKSPLEETALFPLKSIRKMITKEGLMREFELTITRGIQIFFNELCYKKKSPVVMVSEI